LKFLYILFYLAQQVNLLYSAVMADILLLAALLRILSIVCFIGFSCENTHSLHQIHFFDICKCCLDCSTLSHVCLISIYKKDLMTAPAFFSDMLTSDDIPVCLQILLPEILPEHLPDNGLPGKVLRRLPFLPGSLPEFQISS